MHKNCQHNYAKCFAGEKFVKHPPTNTGVEVRYSLRKEITVLYSYPSQKKFKNGLDFQITEAEAENKFLFNQILNSSDQAKREKHNFAKAM